MLFYMIQLVPYTSFMPAAVEALYTASFPANERRPWALQQQLVAAGKLQLAAIQLAGAFMGFISWWTFTGFVFIEHFAVSEAARGKGMGTAAIKALQQQYPVLVLEAEPAGTSALAHRRVAFYQRLGFAVFPDIYLQPPYPGQQQFIPLHLLHTGDAATAGGFTVIQATIYREVYAQG